MYIFVYKCIYVQKSVCISVFICDSTWGKGPYRAYNDFSVLAF